jgi:hypothetical protein
MFAFIRLDYYNGSSVTKTETLQQSASMDYSFEYVEVETNFVNNAFGFDDEAYTNAFWTRN